MLLALLLGAGVHAAGMLGLTAGLKMILGQRNVAGLFLVTFPYFGIPNGFTAAKLYAFFNGSSWMSLAIFATVFYPFTLFACYCLIDSMNPPYSQRLFGEEGISTNSFAALWLFICLPGSAIGAYNGFISEKLSVPTKQVRLSRDIPSRDRVSRC
mmetsp:Transcript_11122/g.13133  ORF Transcript_11122/g.13133 Transcript_11122/m.13133 type:complete len:155 (+) Transcript_11122:521-985(+)